MPNQTLYDNFSQVRQYIDQEKPDLSSYVTKTELSNCGYLTSSDLPIIDESIVPKENNTYTLGDANHLYNATYTSNLYLNSNVGLTSDGIGLFIKTAGNLKFSFDADSFHPYGSTYSGLLDLGVSTRTWRSTYTSNIYTDNVYISNSTYLPKNTYWYDGSSYHWLGILFN